MTWWQYLILVNIYLLLFYGFYAILLSRETFFQLNRIYLVSAALLSFFIPVIQSDWVKNLFITQKVEYTIYSSPVLLYRFKPIEDTHFTVGQLLAIVYLGGIIFLVARFAWQLVILNKIIKKPHSPSAYSFFKKVKLSDGQENQHIIEAHENVHASQWHSADVLIMEALMIINWFNPIVYLYRFAIKHIHEFIADRQALRSGTNKADYALILLSQTFNAPAHQLVTPFFNKSLLKQRIMMLQKNKSHRVALIKYFLSAPLFILMLILSSATVNNSTTIRLLDKKVERVFSIQTTGNADSKTRSGVVKEADFLRLANKTITDRQKAKVLYQVTIKDTTPKTDDKVFTAVEHLPGFPGGVNAFIAFLAKNIQYPAAARQNNIQGRVIISFIVETDGTLTHFEVVRGIGYGADEEALRVLALSPKWTPGTQNGKLVRVAYSVPINFTLAADDGKPAKEDKSGAVDETKGKVINLEAHPVYIGTLGSNNKFAPYDARIFTSNPAYYIDGRSATIGELKLLNPSDIESISVLSNKPETALYGAKGNKGLILVTTKIGLLRKGLLLPQTDTARKQ